MNRVEKVNVEERIEKSIARFDEGYSCAQAVVLTFVDLFGMKSEDALKFSAPFGGGMGRLREVCGAVSGMFMILGWLYPQTDPGDKVSRKTVYDAVQRCAAKFKERMGSYICAELLQLRKDASVSVPTDEIVNRYANRPCSRSVANAVLILCEEINGE